MTFTSVSLTGVTDWDYWIFSGQYLMEVESDFNELFFPLTNVVLFVVWCKCFLKEDVKMVLKPQGDRLFF